MKTQRTAFIWVVMITIIALACSCPVLPSGIGQIQEGIDIIEEMASEIPIVEMAGTAVFLASEMPAEEMLKTAQAIMTEVPLDPDAILKTAQAGGIPDIFGGLDPIDAPPDIPVLEDKNDDFFGSEGVVSYSTTIPFAEVVDFYKREMPNNNWQFMPAGSTEVDRAARLQYDKPQRLAVANITTADGQTIFVHIVIDQK
jgi:hypothetical protein